MKFKSAYLIRIQAILFIVFLFITFFFNRFANDDYQLIGILRESSFKDIYSLLYFEWHGRWTSNLLLVFLLKFNTLPLFLMAYNLLTTGLLYLGIFRLLSSLNQFYQLNLKRVTALIYTAIFLSVLFFCTISANDTWLWYTSSIVYLWSTTAFFFGLNLFFQKRKSFLDFIFFGISAIYIGGSNEPLALITVLILFYLVIKKREVSISGLGIILIFGSFLINYLSPGTIHRDELTPNLGAIDLTLYAGYGAVKFLLFSIHKTFIPALFLSVPFYLLGKKIESPIIQNFNPIKELIWSNIIIIGIVLVNQLIVVYALGGLSPDRSLMVATTSIAIIIVRYIFLLGNYHQQKYKLLKYSLILNVITLIVFNIHFTNVHFNYSKAVDNRTQYILKSEDKLVKVKPLPSSGYIYSTEITNDPNHFKNQHLKNGLGLDKDIVLENY